MRQRKRKSKRGGEKGERGSIHFEMWRVDLVYVFHCRPASAFYDKHVQQNIDGCAVKTK